MASSSNGIQPAKPMLKFTNSSPSLISSPAKGAPNLSGQALLHYRSEAALRLHHIRLAGLGDRWALSFLLVLSLLLAWLIGYSNASPALLVLLGLAALVVGRGRWQQAVEGVGLEADLRVQRKLDTQLRGESAEWMNFLLNRWWTTCSGHILSFTKSYIEPLIIDLLPSGIEKVEVLEVDFGPQTPTVTNMKLSDLPTFKSSSLDDSSTCTLIMNFDLSVSSPDSRIVLRARLGGRNVGCNHLVYVNGLYLSGEIQSLVTLDSRAPYFPNVTKISATFVKKPDIWFSVKVLKGLEVTNIPFLKNFIHSVFMDVLTTLLVDPGKLTMNFDPPPSPQGGGAEDCHAEGVITVTLTARSPAQEKGGDPRHWISLRLRQTKFQQQLALTKGVWRETYSFLVHDLQQEVLVLKVKMRRIMYSSTLAEHSIGLDSLGFVNKMGEEALGERTLKLSNSEVEFDVTLSYSPLPSFSLHTLNGFPAISEDTVCGVLCVHVHSGQDLMASDSNGLSDPYCIVQANKNKILRTHHVRNTLSPSWEKGVEVFVSDITQMVLTFLVFDWDGPLVGDDLLGVAKLTLQDDHSELIQHHLTLVADTSSPNQDLALGKIVVSMVFRPVASVGRASPECHVTTVGGATAQSVVAVGGVAKLKGRCSVQLMGKQRRKEGSTTGGVLEFQLSRGYDLVPKDSNGFSDPYVLVKYGSRIMFRSKVVKKSLNPEWNQIASLAAPSPDDIILVECWDKDMFSDDFLGSVQFSARDLQIFTEREQWCKLEHTKHGQLLLRLTLSEEETVRWSHLDEASRQLIGDVHLEERDVRGSILLRSPSNPSLSSSSSLQSSSIPEDSSDTGGYIGPAHRFASVKSAIHLQPSSDHTPNHIRTSFSAEDSLSGMDHQFLRRRHTLSHQPHPPDFLQFPETRADIQWALNRASDGGGAKYHMSERKEKQITVYHNVSGQVIEATGLKGELDHMELYVKVRLNTRPSYQRQHKFGRGPLVHKTRVLRGSHSPQWKEDFMVKESPVASDSLLTLDLKSGSKVNIGTYAITLDKFFEGQLRATHAFDIGNDVKLRVKISRQLR